MAPAPLLDGSPPLGGVLLVDKPAGISSHTVVARVRRAIGDKTIRVGHAGTLDPFATGLMVVLVGRCTRTAQYFTGLDKRYETVAQLGALSTTGDPEGEITWTGNVPASPLRLPTGEITQVPPAYSAIRIDGVRAYTRARRGETVDVPQRQVTVHDFRELGRDGDVVRLAVHCSSGTYVRTLVSDLGDGYCLELRRTAIGSLSIDDALPLEQLEQRADVEDALRPIEPLLGAFLPVVTLAGADALAIAQGRRVALQTLDREVPAGTPVMAVDTAGIIAITEADGASLTAVVGFRA